MERRLKAVTKALGLAVGMLALGGPAALAASQVSVGLQDQSSGDGMSGMRIEAVPATVKAGRIEFKVTNDSKVTTHELLLVKAPSGPLPYDKKQQRVAEAGLVKFIDTDDIRPGRSVTKAVTLKPGAYEMLCNQPGHYEQGMHATLTVTP